MLATLDTAELTIFAIAVAIIVAIALRELKRRS
jgi:hypothetical protein